MRYFIIMLIIIGVSGFLACSDSEEGPSSTDLLTQSWQTEEVDKNGDDSKANYSFSFRSDNTYNFSTSDQGLSDIPGNGQWEFNSNETRVLLNGGSIELTIISMTSEELILEYSYTNYKDGQVTYRFILKS
ncbi:MAG: hypothetical protein ACNS62_08975 [Candidatus Cyclobacteriaceae bacterium M3_2C_046]